MLADGTAFVTAKHGAYQEAIHMSCPTKGMLVSTAGALQGCNSVRVVLEGFGSTCSTFARTEKLSMALV